MALGDPRVAALARLRSGGLRPQDGPAWAQLLRCVRLLPRTLPLGELHLWPWGSLPLCPAQRPPPEFWAEVMARLPRATQASRTTPVVAPAPRPCPVATPAPRPVLRTVGPAQRRPTRNQTAFYAAVASVPPAEALQAIHGARTAESTKGTYRAAVPLYEAACVRGRLDPWPPSRDTLNLFAGYLKVSSAFASPVTYWWAIVDASRERGFTFTPDRAWAKDVSNGLERGLAPQEQASPLTIPIIRRLAAKVTTTTDFDTVLGLVCAIFTLARIDCFLTLSPDDIRDVDGGKIQVVLSGLKGERRLQVLDPVFDRLPQCAGEFAPLWTPQGVVPLCPVAAFRLLRARAVGTGAGRAAQCGSADAFRRRLDHLCERAGVPQRDPGRNRKLFTAHSTRVAGVCYLLRAGVPEWVVSVLANWSSDQVKRYANRLALHPGLVSPWGFFSRPRDDMRAGSAGPPPKRRKR